MQYRAAKLLRIKCLMRDSISPPVQLLQAIAASVVPRIPGQNLLPEFYTKSVEVGTNIARIRTMCSTHSVCRSRQYPWKCEESSTA